MGKMIFFKGLVLLAGMVALTGCEVDETDSYQVSGGAPIASISTNYSANYSESSNSANVSASFTDLDDGSSVALTDNADVQFDGTSLAQQFDHAGDVSYFTNIPVQLGQTHELYFRDENGNEFTNDFFFPSLVEAVTNQSEYASLQNGYSVGWYATGNITSGDQIHIILRGANGGKVKHADNSGYMNGTTYFSSNEIAEVGNLITLQFCHQQQTIGIQAEDGGTFNLNSCSRLYPVTLEQ